MKDSNEIEFTDLEQWRAAAKAAHPAAENVFEDVLHEAFVAGGDVVADWNGDDGYGWVVASLETAADMKEVELVYFEITEYNVFSHKRGATHLMAANGDLLHAKVATAAAKHIDADTVLLKPLLERPSGIIVVLTDEQVEAA